ncbi:ras gtpase-activating protein [Anaeramoeba ignava]|uniref:Ras gtpase-activating protein n=1 Tax=Anaeramoeba ignava TaxID=1746090 RepID=A0A9Q0LAB8_ANAIG|nr:ras gtpase-activating protein [Anaeramoeba ignava]
MSKYRFKTKYCFFSFNDKLSHSLIHFIKISFNEKEQKPPLIIHKEIIQKISEINNIQIQEKSTLDLELLSIILFFHFSYNFYLDLTSEIIESLKNDSLDNEGYDNLHLILKDFFMENFKGIFQFANIEDLLLEYLYRIGVENAENKTEEILSKVMKKNLGNSIKAIIEYLFEEEEKKLISKFYETKMEEFPDGDANLIREDKDRFYFLKSLSKAKKILKKYLTEEDICYFTSATNQNVSRNSMEPLSTLLCNLIQSLGITLPFIKAIIFAESESTILKGSLFRSNNFCSKVLSKITFRYGKKWIYTTLYSVVKEITQSEGSFEIDEFEVVNEDDLKENVQNLTLFSQKVMDSIIQNLQKVPEILKIICYYLKLATESKFPELVLNVLSGFFFLRFICSALATPLRYEIVNSKLNEESNEALLAISSVVQSWSSGINFHSDNQYLVDLNNLLKTKYSNREELLLQLSDIKEIDKKKLKKNADYGIVYISSHHANKIPKLASKLRKQTYNYLFDKKFFFPENSRKEIEEVQLKMQNIIQNFEGFSEKITENIISIPDIYQNVIESGKYYYIPKENEENQENQIKENQENQIKENQENQIKENQENQENEEINENQIQENQIQEINLSLLNFWQQLQLLPLSFQMDCFFKKIEDIEWNKGLIQLRLNFLMVFSENCLKQPNEIFLIDVLLQILKDENETNKIILEKNLNKYLALLFDSEKEAIIFLNEVKNLKEQFTKIQ